MENTKLPKLKLLGTDGNAFAIIGKMNRCAKENGFSKEQIAEMQKEAMSGDYNKVLATAMKYFDVH